MPDMAELRFEVVAVFLGLALVLAVNLLGRAFKLDEQIAAGVLCEEQVGTLGRSLAGELRRCIFLNGAAKRLVRRDEGMVVPENPEIPLNDTVDVLLQCRLVANEVV